jgi:hypothetical protein
MRRVYERGGREYGRMEMGVVGVGEDIVLDDRVHGRR